MCTHACACTNAHIFASIFDFCSTSRVHACAHILHTLILIRNHHTYSIDFVMVVHPHRIVEQLAQIVNEMLLINIKWMNATIMPVVWPQTDYIFSHPIRRLKEQQQHSFHFQMCRSVVAYVCITLCWPHTAAPKEKQVVKMPELKWRFLLWKNKCFTMWWMFCFVFGKYTLDTISLERGKKTVLNNWISNQRLWQTQCTHTIRIEWFTEGGQENAYERACDETMLRNVLIRWATER